MFSIVLLCREAIIANVNNNNYWKPIPFSAFIFAELSLKPCALVMAWQLVQEWLRKCQL